MIVGILVLWPKSATIGTCLVSHLADDFAQLFLKGPGSAPVETVDLFAGNFLALLQVL